jgi:tetratricopeptide (TPR) repeat protein
MEDKNIQYFIEGIKLVIGEYYIDAIHKFNMLVEESPERDLADDALHNIGLCYFKMNQFELAIDTFNQTISSYPGATISVYDHENAVGLTAAKCYYGIILCYLALGKRELAIEIKTQLDQFSENTYVLTGNQKITYAELADHALKTY